MKRNKIVLTIGAIASTIAPIAVVVSCGSSSSDNQGDNNQGTKPQEGTTTSYTQYDGTVIKTTVMLDGSRKVEVGGKTTTFPKDKVLSGGMSADQLLKIKDSDANNLIHLEHFYIDNTFNFTGFKNGVSLDFTGATIDPEYRLTDRQALDHSILKGINITGMLLDNTTSVYKTDVEGAIWDGHIKGVKIKSVTKNQGDIYFTDMQDNPLKWDSTNNKFTSTGATKTYIPADIGKFIKWFNDNHQFCKDKLTQSDIDKKPEVFAKILSGLYKLNGKSK